MRDSDLRAMSVRCTLCLAAPHQPCRDEHGNENKVPHVARLDYYERLKALASAKEED